MYILTTKGNSAMSKVQVITEIDSTQVLDGLAQFDTATLEEFLGQVGQLLARRKAPNIPKREAELLHKIAHYLSATVRVRYHNLNRKLQDEVISESEYQELFNLVDQVEMADADRLQNLIELAQLRDVSLDTVMEQLGLQQSIVKSDSNHEFQAQLLPKT